MNARLAKDWITAPALDRELKQYILLAYLQGVKDRFDERRLYPHLDDLRARTDELAALARSKEALAMELARELSGFDRGTGRACFVPLPDDEWLRVVDDVIAFSAPELRQMLATGRDLLDEIMARVHLEPIGVIPLDAREGYLMLREGREARVYAYSLSLVHVPVEGSVRRTLTTRYVTTFTITITRRYEQIKADLMRHERHLPNPAAFAFECAWDLPRVETCLPIARQLVLERIRGAA